MNQSSLFTLRGDTGQQAAILAGSGTHLVVAAPGSGKTHVIVQRFCRLLTEGADPEQVLSLTFTREAAKEMRQRADKIIHFPDKPKRACGFLTLHSLALRFAEQERDAFGFPLAPFPLATPGQYNRMLSVAASKYNLDFRELRKLVSLMRRSGQLPVTNAYDPRTLSMDLSKRQNMAGYTEYDRQMRQAGILDFDSLIFYMNLILRGQESVLEKWQYKWLQVDEAQDLDAVQWSIIQQLSRDCGNVLAVGDCQQSVYEFRGAEPKLFLDFGSMFPNSQTHLLATNYRSTGKIVAFCQEHAPVKDSPLQDVRSANDAGIDPEIRQYTSNIDEASSIIVEHPDKTCGILARTNRQLLDFEEACGQENLPYHLLGKSGFWQQQEVRYVMAFLRLASNSSRSSSTDIVTAIKSPFDCTKGIHKTELLEQFQKNKMAFYLNLWQNGNDATKRFVRFVDGLRGTRKVSEVVEALKAVEYYDRDEVSDTDNNPADNLLRLVQISNRFPSPLAFCQHANKMMAVSKTKKGVALSTIHQAKGKEWDTVYVVGVNEGTLPHAKGEYGEESRLFFVAISRAARKLVLSYWGTPSSFLTKHLMKEKENDEVKAS